MRRLLRVPELAAEINALKSDKKHKVANSADFLLSQRSFLQQYQSVEHLVLDPLIKDIPSVKIESVEYHLVRIRAAIARKLWSRQIFIGTTVLDELLFESIVDSTVSNPVFATLQKIQRSELSRPGLIVLPLHSFGILGAGLLGPLARARVHIVDPVRGFAISPQTNKLDDTISFIDMARRALGVCKSVPENLIRHWRVSRSAAWLERNPLIIARVTSTAGLYYENEFLLVGKLRSLAGSIAMLVALQRRDVSEDAQFFSSSNINNFETLDIHHYLVFSEGPQNSMLQGRAVPIHHRREVLELTDLAAEVDPRYWRRQGKLATRVHQANDLLFEGYVTHSIGRFAASKNGQLYRKIFDAVSYYRGSFRDDWSSAVSLATAFEMLLTDTYSAGVTDRLRRRTQLLLRGVRGTRRMQESVKQVYEARSQIVHRGERPSLDLSDARHAFVLVFLALMERLSSLPSGGIDNPMAVLTGDI